MWVLSKHLIIFIFKRIFILTHLFLTPLRVLFIALGLLVAVALDLEVVLGWHLTDLKDFIQFFLGFSHEVLLTEVFEVAVDVDVWELCLALLVELRLEVRSGRAIFIRVVGFLEVHEHVVADYAFFEVFSIFFYVERLLYLAGLFEAQSVLVFLGLLVFSLSGHLEIWHLAHLLSGLVILHLPLLLLKSFVLLFELLDFVGLEFFSFVLGWVFLGADSGEGVVCI
jgi:hypothetical protein